MRDDLGGVEAQVQDIAEIGDERGRVYGLPTNARSRCYHSRCWALDLGPNIIGLVQGGDGCLR